MKTLLFLSLAFQAVLCGQEADSGLDLRATISVQGAYSERLAAAPRSGEPVAGGFRSVLYPNWKLSPNWTLSGALQISSRPYFFEQFSTQGYGLKTDVLQAHLSYSRFWKKSSSSARACSLPRSALFCCGTTMPSIRSSTCPCRMGITTGEFPL